MKASVMDIQIDNRYGSELPIGRIQELAGFVLQSEGIDECTELSISFVTVGEITELNGLYRNKPEPTDVLSFALDDPGDGPDDWPSDWPKDVGPRPLQQQQQPPQPEADPQPRQPQQQLHLLGDIVINPDIAQKHAVIEEVNLEEEFWILVIHGILHLLGYDHEKSEDAIVMEEREDHYFYHWQLRIGVL